MFKLAAALSLAAVFSSSVPEAATAREADAFNGAWSVELVTESGVCESRASYAVSVQDGQVRLVSPSERASLSGRVHQDGTIGLTVSNGTASGSVSGRLQARSGTGTWKASAFCSGRWTATRQTTRTAQAE